MQSTVWCGLIEVDKISKLIVKEGSYCKMTAPLLKRNRQANILTSLSPNMRSQRVRENKRRCLE